MSMTIGRATIDENPTGESLRMRGDEVEFDCDLGASSVNEYKAVTQQLRGLVGNEDEPVVPFTWSEDPTLDGYYRVTGVDVEPSPVVLATGHATARVRMERIAGGFARPRIEVVTTMVGRTNSHGVSSPGALLMFAPAEAGDLDQGALSVTGSASWSVAGGTTLTAYQSTNASSVGNKSYRYSHPAAAHYYGSATIEADFGGTFYDVSGPHVAADFGDAGNWRLGNGLVRCYSEWNAGNGNFDLKVESWNGSGWSGTVFSPADASVALGGPPLFYGTAARVVRNSPEQCVLRFDNEQLTTFVSIARGQPFVVVNVVETVTSPTYQMGWEATAPGAPAATSIVGGGRANANDSNGRRWLISCPSAVTFAGAVYLTTSALTSTWQLCPDYLVEITPNSGLSMRNYFFAGTTFKQRVIAR